MNKKKKKQADVKQTKYCCLLITSVGNKPLMQLTAEEQET